MPGNVNVGRTSIDVEARPYSNIHTEHQAHRVGLDAAFGGGGTAQTNHSRTYSYDLNGNMKKARSKEGANLHQGKWLEWTWNSGNGNRPVTWHQERQAVQFPAPSTEEADESYGYDAVGNRTAVLDGQGDTLNVMRYNRLNLPEEYTTASGDEVQYVYSADGEKLFVQLTTSANVTTGTEYAANYRVEDGTLTMIHTDAGYYALVPPPSGAGNPSYSHVWYLKDHLGNNRILADGSGNLVAAYFYDPFGKSIGVATVSPPSFENLYASPYKYGGKEWNATTSTYDFEARQMAPGFHRFTTMDPLCEKYYGISPYAYCANNPVNMVDPKGQDWVYDQEMQQYIWRDDVDSIDKTSAGFEYVGKDNTSILLHAGFITPVQTQRYTSNGFILNDFDFVHRASVQGESVVYVQVNTSYSEDAESETNRQGRVFTGLTVVANEIVDIISTADNTEATFSDGGYV